MIVILGATGYVGNALLRHMAARAPGRSFRVAGRNRTKLRALEKLPNVSSAVVWEQSRPLDPVVENATAVIDLSFTIRGVPSEVVIGARTHGEALVAAARRAGAGQVVLLSSVAVYGEPRIRYGWTSPPPPAKLRPRTIYGACKANTEIGAARANDKDDVAVSVLRCGHVFGVGSAMAGNLATRILCGDPTLLEGPDAPSNATGTVGLANAIARLLDNPPEPGTRWGNHVDMSALSYDDIVARIGDSLGIAPVEAAYRPVRPQASDLLSRGFLLQRLRSRQKQILYLQSKVGRYDFGLSAALMKSAKRRIGGAMSLVAAPPVQEAKALEPLYLSDAVPHSADVAGPAADDDAISALFASVAASLSAGGFRQPD